MGMLFIFICARFIGLTTSGYTARPCGGVPEHSYIQPYCPDGSVITRIDFASYGTPYGGCPYYGTGWCNAGSSYNVLYSSCQGTQGCSVHASNDVFGDPCPNTFKALAGEFICMAIKTYPSYIYYYIPWFDYARLDIVRFSGYTESQCASACSAYQNCLLFVTSPDRYCWLKSGHPVFGPYDRHFAYDRDVHVGGYLNVMFGLLSPNPSYIHIPQVYFFGFDLAYYTGLPTASCAYYCSINYYCAVFSTSIWGECWLKYGNPNQNYYGRASISVYDTYIKTSYFPAIASPLGCYTDTANRALSTFFGYFDSTVECYNRVLRAGYRYFSMQNGNECWATTNYYSAVQYGSSGSCYYNCLSGENCGGPWGNRLYSIASPLLHLGCYTDSPTRALVLYRQWTITISS